MEIDKTSLLDLNIFHPDEESSIFHRLNFTRTLDGKEWLRRMFREPFHDIHQIMETQKILTIIGQKLEIWPQSISNGTIMVIGKFYESPIDTIPGDHSLINGISYKLFHSPDFAIVRYSVGHFADFIRGFQELTALLDSPESPAKLRALLDRAAYLLKNETLQELSQLTPGKKYDSRETIRYGSYLRYRFKNQSEELIEIYSRIDAWYSMATAMKHLDLHFPEINLSEQPYIEAKGLYHILLPQPVSYDLTLDIKHNFLFLTGANMAGKSTFIKSVGASVYLAHLGMGVPAEKMSLSLFEGILSNINVTDNIIKGESYFFNEVQRIKNTIIKINDGRKWLVLIDELFKGTNVQDAMKCSLTVVRGLIRIPNSLFILSTHLYEIGEELKQYSNILFRFFETEVLDDQLYFSYQLREGISNDRLGYLILKREKVVEMLDNIP